MTQAKGEQDKAKRLTKAAKEIQKRAEQIEDLAYVLSVAGGESRLRILLLLYQVDELCPGEIGEALNISTPAVSQQLRRLREVKLVKHRRKGKQVYYTLSPKTLDYIKSILDPVLKNAGIVQSGIDLF